MAQFTFLEFSKKRDSIRFLCEALRHVVAEALSSGGAPANPCGLKQNQDL